MAIPAYEIRKQEMRTRYYTSKPNPVVSHYQRLLSPVLCMVLVQYYTVSVVLVLNRARSRRRSTHLGRYWWWINWYVLWFSETKNQAYMGHQWCFVLDDETVVTFSAPKEKDSEGEGSQQGDLRKNIYQEINGDYARQCNDCMDFAALAVFHAVQALLDHTGEALMLAHKLLFPIAKLENRQPEPSSFPHLRGIYQRIGEQKFMFP